MKIVFLSLFLLLIVVCLVHTKSCKEKCKRKANPEACKKRCREAKTASKDDSGRGDFIIGGNDTAPGEYPWQGSLHYKPYDVPFCGLAVIDEHYVITAAHCAGALPPEYVEVVLAYHDLSNLVGAKRYDIKTVTEHPDYLTGEGSYPNDIAVIEVEGTIDLTDPKIDKITMAPNDGYTYKNSECYITGWGYITAVRDVSLVKGFSFNNEDQLMATFIGECPQSKDVLQEAQIDVITNKKCRKSWKESINDGHICVYDKNENKGSCNGDSGTPLQCKRDGNWVLVGVTSWGIKYCYTTYPSVYTRISYFVGWIKDVAEM